MGDLRIRVAGVDPALKNMGIARASLLLVPAPYNGMQPHKIEVDSLDLIQTDKQTTKVVRQNSDDLRRCRDLAAGVRSLTDVRFVFAEIPVGAQSARAAFSFGVATAVMAFCPVPLIQVQPNETKLATVGTKTASKQEMIEWAVETYPNAPWLMHRGKPKLDNEHLADACAIIHAGVKTDEFLRFCAMMQEPVAA